MPIFGIDMNELIIKIWSKLL